MVTKIKEKKHEPTLSVSDVTVSENGLTATFQVTLDAVSNKKISVEYATADVSALAGKDYAATSGTLSFNAGETTKLVAVSLIDDQITEETEVFTLSLSGQVNATVKDFSGEARIISDDVPNIIRDNGIANNYEGLFGTVGQTDYLYLTSTTVMEELEIERLFGISSPESTK